MKKKYRRGVRNNTKVSKKRYRRGARRPNWFVRMALWKKIVLFLFILIFAVLALGVWYVFTKWQKIDTHEIKAEDIVINKEVQENMSVDLGDGYTNIALFGVDTREGDLGAGSRTDCIIVASLNNKTKEVKMVSVYRDTLLDLSEGTYQKCNAAYSFGGPTMAINMLNMNLDMNIQEYITVDFGAISDVIDLLGGLDMEVTDEEAMYINEHIVGTGMEAGKEAYFLEQGGNLHLDGVQATTYARIRSTSGGDFTRTQRQRIVIEKILEKVKGTDLATINAIIDEVFPKISTSFTMSEILSYAKAYKEYVIAGSEGFPYEDLMTMDSIPDVGSVVVPYELSENVSRMHEFLFGTMNYEPSSTVHILSGNILSRLGSGGSTVNNNGMNYSDDESDDDWSDYQQSGDNSTMWNGNTTSMDDENGLSDGMYSDNSSFSDNTDQSDLDNGLDYTDDTEY